MHIWYVCNPLSKNGIFVCFCLSRLHVLTSHWNRDTRTHALTKTPTEKFREREGGGKERERDWQHHVPLRGFRTGPQDLRQTFLRFSACRGTSWVVLHRTARQHNTASLTKRLAERFCGKGRVSFGANVCDPHHFLAHLESNHTSRQHTRRPIRTSIQAFVFA